MSEEQNPPDDPQEETTHLKPYNRVDLNKAFRDYQKGNSFAQIARDQGVTRQSVRDRLQPLIEMIKDPQQVQAYRENEADLLDGVTMKLARNIAVKADDPKASVNNLAYAYTQLNNAKRLLRGQSTSNINALTSIIELAHGKNRTSEKEITDTNQ